VPYDGEDKIQAVTAFNWVLFGQEKRAQDCHRILAHRHRPLSLFRTNHPGKFLIIKLQ